MMSFLTRKHIFRVRCFKKIRICPILIEKRAIEPDPYEEVSVVGTSNGQEESSFSFTVPDYKQDIIIHVKDVELAQKQVYL